MTENAQISSNTSEYGRDVSSEKPQFQVIDIIDQIANSVEIYPYEEAEPTASTIPAQENQEGPNHLVENGACKVSVGGSELQGNPERNGEKKTDSPTQQTGDWEDDESGKGLCEGSQSTRTKEPQEGGQSKLEERKTWRPPDEKMTCSTDQAEEEPEEVDWRGPKGQMQEEAPLKDLGSVIKEDSKSQEGEVQNEGNRDVHKKRQEATSKQPLPVSPSCNPQTEKPDEQPGILKKNDIYRHSYSRYNTISYRKIRKGNTKQRIDEFESMMHS